MSTSTSPRKLEGKVALVTGAGGGIGAAIAADFAAAGARVVINDARSTDAAQQLASSIIAAGGHAIVVQADVTWPDDVERLIAATIDAYGRLDTVVNNAGVYEFKALEDITPEHFDKHFNINVLAGLLVTQKALPHLQAAGGSVINISSTTSLSPAPGGSVYSASKAAVDAVTRSLAKELGARGIRVNAISPGTVETPGFHGTAFSSTEVRQQIVATTPLGRLGRPGDISPVAVFLASDDARWVTGKLVAVDGGQY